MNLLKKRLNLTVSEENIKDWYNKKHLTKGKNAWRPYEAYSIFLDYLNVKPGKKLLDVGCGTGYLLKESNRRGLKTYGQDISNEAIKIAKKVSLNSKILVGKGENLRFPRNHFDYITCLGALEHFLDMEKGINEMVRVAKKEALFCIVVPNINCGIGWLRGTEQQDINENLLSLKQWKNFFRKQGFEILRVHQDKWFMNQIKVLSSANPLRIMNRVIHKSIWKFLPLNYAYQFIFIMKKK